MILCDKKYFVLSTKQTTYAFRVMETGHLEHLYYGRRLRVESADDVAVLVEQQAYAPGTTCGYDDDHRSLALEDCCLEVSSYGRGDTREPYLDIVYSDGSFTSDFTYEMSMVSKGKAPYHTLPGSYDDSEQVDHLLVVLREKHRNVKLELHYYVYENCDVITRSAKLTNIGDHTLRLNRMLSNQVDFAKDGYVFTTFNGGWGREMKRNDHLVESGKHISSVYTGNSSNQANPFVMVSRPETTEDAGECYGFNLIYSGNHYEVLEVNPHGKTRFASGINPQSFCFTLKSGEYFEAPEAVMTYSHKGFNEMSQHMHAFIREHIVRGTWKSKVRPVLLNSWEAAYFDINERKLLNLAKTGKEVGIELFVMDDGWFGTRNDDTQALGDWQENMKKLPYGVHGLAKKIKELGMNFGLWVEPEMVNVKSKLYEAHPDWVLQIPGQAHSEGRNQRILDLSKTEVQDYIIDAMRRVFRSGDISYVKWDMNRNVSDAFSQGMSAEYQGEMLHKYYIGFYRCMQTLTEEFPDILFEGCASGGNRFDLGMLCYFPQIWASDDTDALCRAEIQNGYSYGYPMSTVSAHVSACPNHQTLRNTPLETRFNVAAFGLLGYECNLAEMNKEDLAAIKVQIELYKEWRKVLQFGSFYRGRSFHDGVLGTGSVLKREAGNQTEWCCVSPDKEKAVGLLMQKLAVPNTRYDYFQARGLDPEKKYHFTNRKLKYNIKGFGGLVNMVSPVHIKQDSLVHNLAAKFVKMDGETEDTYAYGDVLMYHGVKLHQAFAGTGYDDKVRYYQDFGSRIYFMEAKKVVR